MARVRMLTSIAAAQFAYEAGDICELDDKTARNLIRTKQAEPVGPRSSRPEKATAPEVEAAVTRGPGPG